MPSRFFRTPLSSRRHSRADVSAHPIVVGAAAVITALTISALVNRLMAKKAERNNPPIGKFVDVGGVRLH
ncbi:MAG: hypothetical protein WCD52_22260, partial [Xanthobacteraceae bacterium]